MNLLVLCMCIYCESVSLIHVYLFLCLLLICGIHIFLWMEERSTWLFWPMTLNKEVLWTMGGTRLPVLRAIHPDEDCRARKRETTLYNTAKLCQPRPNMTASMHRHTAREKCCEIKDLLWESLLNPDWKLQIIVPYEKINSRLKVPAQRAVSNHILWCGHHIHL